MELVQARKAGMVVVSAAALGLAAVGVSGIRGPWASEHPTDTGPLVLYAGAWNEDDALLTGTLVLEGNCLYVEWTLPTEEGVFRAIPAFRGQGTWWDAEERAVHIDGVVLRVGEHFQTGGGQLGDASRVGSDFWAVPPDSSCDTSNIWLVGKP